MARPVERSAPHAGFDFTLHIDRLCRRLAADMAELAHVDMAHVAVAYCQSRVRGLHGLQASLTPLRFEGGSLTIVRRRKKWTIQRLYGPDGQERLYILSFYLPRFLNQSFEEKLTTVFHELWHISPEFNGDLRRHPGRCYAHSSSQKEYDRAMWQLACQWLDQNPPPEIYDFLRLNFSQLCQQHGRVFGQRIRRPLLIPAAT